MFNSMNPMHRSTIDCGSHFKFKHSYVLVFSPKIHGSFYKKTRAWCMPASRPRTRISNQTVATPVVKFRTGTSATASPPIVMGSPFAPCCDLERRPTCKSLLPDFFTVPQNVVHKRFHPRCFGAMLSDLDTSSTAQWTPSPVQFMCSLCS